MTVLLIMLLHGVPVFIIGIWSDSKGLLAISAIISGLIGVLTGNPVWMLADLFSVFIGYSLASSFMTSDEVQEQDIEEFRKQMLKDTDKPSGWNKPKDWHG